MMKDLVIDIISEILEAPIERNKTFEWSAINQYSLMDIRVHKDLFSNAYSILGADYSKICKIQRSYFPCDAYFGGPCNFIFEYDTLNDFCTHRENVLSLCLEKLKTNYDIEKWINYCRAYKNQADLYQKNQKVNGFNPPNGKSAKRALIDFIKDARPQIENLSPTMRICEFEVKSLNVHNKNDRSNYVLIEKLLKEKLTN